MDRLPNFLVILANRVAKFPLAKSILKPFYYSFKQKVNKNLNDKFRVHALDLLKNFDECMQDLDIQYTLIFGSLLGAIREKGFIGHDLDIDVAIFYDDRSKMMIRKLEDYGFHIHQRFSIDDGHLGCEESFLYKNTDVSIDIFYIHPAINEDPYVCCWNRVQDSVTFEESMKKYGYVIPRRIELPIDRKMIRVDFEDIKVNITKNAHKVSEYSYGPNYMIPDPYYVAPTEHRVVWIEKRATFQEF